MTQRQPQQQRQQPQPQQHQHQQQPQPQQQRHLEEQAQIDHDTISKLRQQVMLATTHDLYTTIYQSRYSILPQSSTRSSNQCSAQSI